MAEKDDKKPSGDGKAAAPPKSMKKLLLFVGLGVAAIAAVGAGTFFLLNGKKSAAGKDNTVAAREEKEEEKEGHGGGHGGGHGKEGEGKEGEKTNPLFFNLEPFILNLADVDSNRYLKISVTIEFTDAKATAEAEARTPQIRDAMILLMSSLTYGDVHSVEGKLTLQSEIQNRLNKIMETGQVKRVYFTDLVVQ